MILRVLLLLLTLYFGCYAEDLTGICTKVISGDVLTVVVDEIPLRVRLYGIDSPKRGQPFNRRARHFLTRLVYHKQVSVRRLYTDRYDRIIGVVMLGDIEINREMIAGGMSWVNPEYCQEEFCLEYVSLESLARDSGIGLWSEEEPVAPWEWSQKKPEKSTDIPAVVED